MEGRQGGQGYVLGWGASNAGGSIKGLGLAIRGSRDGASKGGVWQWVQGCGQAGCWRYALLLGVSKGGLSQGVQGYGQAGCQGYV